MFTAAETGHAVSNEDFRAAEEGLRVELLDAQYDVLDLDRFAVLLLINGVDGAGKGETVNLLNEWMDPRHIQTLAFDTPTVDEAAHPFMWRFWNALPPRGKIGVLFNNWYTDPILQRVERSSKRAELDHRVYEIRHFENMLVSEGVVLLKFWFHLSKPAQKKRLKELEKDERTSWRVTERDWRFYELYDRYRDVAGEVLRATDSAEAPWLVVDGSDPNYRALFVARSLLTAMRRRVDSGGLPPQRSLPPLPLDHGAADVLGAVTRQDMPRKEHDELLEPLQGRLARLVRRAQFRAHALVLVFEGMDAAGKGGAIRRVAAALDARSYRIVPVSAPTEEERRQPYLWRFWRRVPPRGKVVMFDRSWYGRVLVERVEELCAEGDWMRAYGEINDFEEQLHEAGAIVVKFWLAVSKDEQLKRFEEREAQQHKRFKITPEDWRNRDKWDDYTRAANQMFAHTGTAVAPWTVVEADDKHFARIKVLSTICERLEAALG